MVEILLENQAYFLGYGAFSLCFVSGDRTKVFAFVDDEKDQSKYVLSECEPDKHLPKIKKLVGDYDLSLYEMPYYEVLDTNQMNAEQWKIFNNLCKLSYLESSDLTKENWHVFDLPESLRKTFKKLLKAYDECVGYDTLDDIDIKDENVGWVGNDVILFDMFYSN